jgi:hypothetical protein
METLFTTFQQIANILSFKTDAQELNQSLSPNQTDWDSIVKISSKHLVLPTIFCRLKQKNALHVLPNELSSYLEEITQINRNRNSTLFNEAKGINSLFSEHDIDHVFIKGIALIAGNYFEDFGERMIGDIDILVHTKDLEKANLLLIKKNYKPIKQTISSKFFKDKHLPRLINANKIGAIELHKNLFTKNKDISNFLDVNRMLSTKRRNFLLNIPSHDDLLAHNILNYQLNDHGFYFNAISLRAAYDSITILKKDKTQHLSSKSAYVQKYFNNLSIFFLDISPSNTTKIQAFKQKFFVWKHKFKVIGKLWYLMLKYNQNIIILTHRILYFIKNKEYREAILKDRKRVRNVLLKRMK